MSQDSHSSESSRGVFIRNMLGLGLLVVAIIASTVQIFTKEHEINDPRKTVLRLCHWQLELGYRDALEKMIAEYEKLHPDVKIVQQPITERYYSAWLNTQLISREAPDIAEMGMSKLLTDDSYMVRFFLPLGDIVEQPNPYNAGTDLASIPWRETFIDGMRGGYKESLQDYYCVPTTTCAMRLFYNKQLLRQITGSDVPPATFGRWMAVCKQIKAWSQDQVRKGGKPCFPILSNYKVEPFTTAYTTPFTAWFDAVADVDMNADLTKIETAAAFASKAVRMDSPQLRGLYELVKQICDNMPVDFAGMDRQRAQYFFVQQQGAFLATGSWDGESVYELAKEAGFDVGVIPFPLPAKGEPFGDLVIGKRNEANSQGIGPYGIYKFSRNQEQAIDFLRFLASRKYNEMFNREAGWPPVIIGAETKELMKPFQPEPEGYNAQLQLNVNADIEQIWRGQSSKYLSGESTYEEFAKAYEDALASAVGCDKAWGQEYDKRVRECRDQDRILAMLNCRVLYGVDVPRAPSTAPASRPADENDPRVKYRKVLTQQIIRNNGEDFHQRFKDFRPGVPIPPP